MAAGSDGPAVDRLHAVVPKAGWTMSEQMSTAQRLREWNRRVFNVGPVHDDLAQAADELEALTRERDDLKAKLAQVEAVAQRRLELLRTMQWCCSVTGILTEGRCPKCFGCDPHHSKDCPLAAELEEKK